MKALKSSDPWANAILRDIPLCGRGQNDDGWYTETPKLSVMASLPTSNESRYRSIQRGWPVILFAGIVGGLAGLAFSYLQPPRFEAMAAVSIAIDYARTLPMDESTERQALNRVLDLILSDATLEHAVQLMPDSVKSEAEISSQQNLRDVIRLRDLRGRWELLATAVDPQIASALADAWAMSAIENAKSSLSHAWRAAELQQRIFSLGCDLEETPSGSALWSCQQATDEDEAEVLVESLLLEAELSHGLIPALSVSLLEAAVPPSESNSRSAAVYALAGTIAGLVTGTFLVALRGSATRPNLKSTGD